MLRRTIAENFFELAATDRCQQGFPLLPSKSSELNSGGNTRAVKDMSS